MDLRHEGRVSQLAVDGLDQGRNIVGLVAQDTAPVLAPHRRLRQIRTKRVTRLPQRFRQPLYAG